MRLTGLPLTIPQNYPEPGRSGDREPGADDWNYPYVHIDREGDKIR